MKHCILFLILFTTIISCKVDIEKKHHKFAKKFQKNLQKPSKNRTGDGKAGDSKTHIAKSKSRGVRSFNSEDMKEWINTYMTYNYLSYPKYYIINTTELISYLDGVNPKPNYLHLYIAKNNQTNDLDLVIIPTDEYTGNENYNYKHRTNSNIFSNLTRSTVCGVPHDDTLDAANFPYPAVNLPPAPPDKTTIITRALGKQRITSFQELNQFEFTYSLVMNTSNLYDFLKTQNHQYPQTQTGIVPYLQFYLAYAQNDTSQLTIVMVGLNNYARHVYYRPDPGTNDIYVFEAAVPCPYCGVEPEPAVDNRPQYY